MTKKEKNKFTILDHTADLKIRVKGKTPEDLFLEALKGMAHLLCHHYQAGQTASVTMPIKVSSIDINSLLIDFLSEVLYQSEINQAVFFKAKMKKFTNSQIEAELLGRSVSKFDRNIKAVTYHGVSVRRNSDNLWQTEIVFDV